MSPPSLRVFEQTFERVAMVIEDITELTVCELRREADARGLTVSELYDTLYTD
jgi:hypothetical protein